MAFDPKKKGAAPKKGGPPAASKGPPSQGPQGPGKQMGPPDGDADDTMGAPPGIGAGPPPGMGAEDPTGGGVPPDLLAMLLSGGGMSGGLPGGGMPSPMGMPPGIPGMPMGGMPPIGAGSPTGAPAGGPPMFLQSQPLTQPQAMGGPGQVDPRIAAALMGTAPHPTVTAPGESGMAFDGVPGAQDPSLGLSQLLDLLALAQSGAGPNF